MGFRSGLIPLLHPELRSDPPDPRDVSLRAMQRILIQVERGLIESDVAVCRMAYWVTAGLGGKR